MSNTPSTIDALFRGNLDLRQHRHGDRVTLDSLLLTGAVRDTTGLRVLDLGCGNGVVSLVTAYLYQPVEILGVDIQPQLVALARENAARNQLDAEFRVMDVRQYRGNINPNHFDLAVCNPPYYTVDSGRLNPNSERAAARHETHGGLEDFVLAAKYALHPKGMLWLVYPATRLMHLMSVVFGAGLNLQSLRMVHPHLDRPARLVLLSAKLGGGPELRVLPPLVIHRDGAYHPIVQALLDGETPRYPGAS